MDQSETSVRRVLRGKKKAPVVVTMDSSSGGSGRSGLGETDGDDAAPPTSGDSLLMSIVEDATPSAAVQAVATNSDAAKKTAGSSKGKPSVVRKKFTGGPQIPLDIVENQALQGAIQQLPCNYSFEIPKTLWRIRQTRSKMAALQFPEGLLMYACMISDILQQFGGVETVIMGDVTYGACCVDDFTARALGCDFIVHYGHSCLVPIDVSQMNMLYVFVDITFNTDHLVETIKHHFSEEDKIVLAGTIQFSTSIHSVRKVLKASHPQLQVPQARPLSQGEVLGCTSPKLCDADSIKAVVFVADGRFHMESLMIHNPAVQAFYKYDPYGKKFTVESYDHRAMGDLRQAAIARAKTAGRWGFILGTLGRQGNPDLLDFVKSLLDKKGIPHITVLLSEIFPAKLAAMQEVEAWVQVACPRLSVDWGYAFETPLLNTYEATVAVGETEWQEVYPMDYYAADGGKWTNYKHKAKVNPSTASIATSTLNRNANPRSSSSRGFP